MLRYTLRQLEYFVATGEAGSIARAAQRVNVSSPSISTAIAQLERECGLSLFVRHHAQGLTLTQAGREIFVQAQIVLRAADGLLDVARSISGTVHGPLAVGCLLTLAQVILSPLRRSFENAFPEVRIRQRELDQAAIFGLLRRAEIDVALTYDMDVPADLRFVPLATLPPYALVGCDHPLADRTTVTADDLRPHPMVLLDLPYSADYFLSLFDGPGGRPRVAERTRDMAVMRSMVANGFGYSIANIRTVDTASPDGATVRFIPLAGNPRPIRMGLLMARGADSASVIGAFIDHCRGLARDGALPGLRPPN